MLTLVIINSTSGLRDVLGLNDPGEKVLEQSSAVRRDRGDTTAAQSDSNNGIGSGGIHASQSIEAAMAAFEDEEDVSAMRGAKREAALESGTSIPYPLSRIYSCPLY